MTVEEVIKETCRHLNLPEHLIHAKSREGNIIKARQIADKICKDELKMSLYSIGKAIGGKAHATVLHAIKEANKFIDVEFKYREDYEAIINRLKSVNNEIMSDKEFCELYNMYTGEGGVFNGIDNPKQLTVQMTGEELKEWTEFAIQQTFNDT